MATLIVDYIKYYPHDTLGFQVLKGVGLIIKNIDKPFIDHDMDRYLDEFVRNLFSEFSFDKIFIPASFGPVFTDYLGFRLAYHIRLTQALGTKRFIPIVIYSSSPFEDIFHCTTLVEILRTTGTYLIDLDKEMIADYSSRNLSCITSEFELITQFQGLKVELPKSYYDSHSIANEWGVYQLDMISGTNQLSEKENPKFLSLYFKWLRVVSSPNRKRDDNISQEENRIKVQIKTVGKIDLSKIKYR